MKQPFKTFYEINFPVICQFVAKILHFVGPIEEISNDTFLAVWQSDTKFMTDYDRKNFAFRVAKNKVLNYCKKPKLKIVQGEIEEDQASEPEFLAMIEFESRHAFIISCIMQQIEYLPNQQKQVFKLKYIKGKDAKEISVIMNLKIKTVYNHLERACKSLKIHIEQNQNK